MKNTERGWSNATQGFSGVPLGVTLFVDLRQDAYSIRRSVQQYCEAKAAEVERANWVGIGEGGSGGLFVVVLERDPELPFVDVFLEPPHRTHCEEALSLGADRSEL